MGRLLLIGVSGLAGGLLFIWVFAIQYPVRFPDWLGFLLFGVACALGAAMAWHFCGRPRFSWHDTAPDFDKLGLLEDQTFSARRAFKVEEYEDEGLHFFIELSDGRVLYLSGQYLYDYAETGDDPDLSQPASFPCTEFVVRRHKTERWVHSLVCRGSYLAPVETLPAFSQTFVKTYDMPSDGDILTESFEQLRARIAAEDVDRT